MSDTGELPRYDGIRVVAGDLLDVESGMIAHQCNCMTRKGRGLSASLFKKYPEANTYRHRDEPSTPGTVVFTMINSELSIANLYAQEKPGKWGYYSDTPGERLEWFSRLSLHYSQRRARISPVRYRMRFGSWKLGQLRISHSNLGTSPAGYRDSLQTTRVRVGVAKLPL